MGETGQNRKVIVAAFPRSGSVMTWQMVACALGDNTLVAHTHQHRNQDRDIPAIVTYRDPAICAISRWKWQQRAGFERRGIARDDINVHLKTLHISRDQIDEQVRYYQEVSATIGCYGSDQSRRRPVSYLCYENWFPNQEKAAELTLGILDLFQLPVVERSISALVEFSSIERNQQTSQQRSTKKPERGRLVRGGHTNTGRAEDALSHVSEQDLDYFNMAFLGLRRRWGYV